MAAAEGLNDIEIQIELEQAQSDPAERFLRDDGLGAQLVSDHSRLRPNQAPRPNKALRAIIADVFAKNFPAAQWHLRQGFLGDTLLPEIAQWIDVAFRDVSAAAGKVLIWVRKAVYDAERNRAELERARICCLPSTRDSCLFVQRVGV